MKIKLIVIFIIIAIIFACGIFYYNNNTLSYKSFLAYDGQSYMFLEHESETFSINGVAVKDASRDQLLDSFESNSATIQPMGAISTAEQAAKQGVYILNQTFEKWTCENRIGVLANNRENIWIVHGQVEYRGSEDKLGVVVFDAITGEVLGVDLVDPEGNNGSL